MKKYTSVCDRYDPNGGEYTLKEFLDMCVDCFGDSPKLTSHWDKNGNEYFLDEEGIRVLQAGEK